MEKAWQVEENKLVLVCFHLLIAECTVKKNMIIPTLQMWKWGTERLDFPMKSCYSCLLIGGRSESRAQDLVTCSVGCVSICKTYWSSEYYSWTSYTWWFCGISFTGNIIPTQRMFRRKITRVFREMWSMLLSKHWCNICFCHLNLTARMKECLCYLLLQSKIKCILFQTKSKRAVFLDKSLENSCSVC